MKKLLNNELQEVSGGWFAAGALGVVVGAGMLYVYQNYVITPVKK